MVGHQHFPFGPYWPLNAVNPDGSLPNIAYSVEFGCYRVNGVLAPNPVSYALPMDTRSDDEQPPTGPSLKRRRLNQGEHPMLFQLYKFSNRGEQYLVELHEPNASTTRYHHLNVFEEKGKWVMRVVAMSPGNHAVQPLLEDPSPPVFEKRSDLPLQQRLGGWTLENRVRKSDGREDKFYYHQGKQYKSFVQLLTFILYANKDLKDLRLNPFVPGEQAVNQVQQENGDVGGASGLSS